ncbi:MAG: 16S rRNA (guanine(966)-N(2))-methyltransferase RsmD [Bacteroidales bacterium]|nr:16S rRNA (guanine(966)-N(2))-methyltransferase RsmD [Bacteroidales bacterium]
MRIISGKNRGRKINPPKNLHIRPTTDFAKESLFNIINNNFDYENIDVLDLFSGTGCISYEFASRGAKSVIAVEKSFKCIDFISKNVYDIKFSNIKVIRANVFSFLNTISKKFDLIFADPPYSLPNIEKITDLVFSNKLLNKNGCLIIEHSEKSCFSNHEYFLKQRSYGSVNFSFLSEDQNLRF